MGEKPQRLTVRHWALAFQLCSISTSLSLPCAAQLPFDHAVRLAVENSPRAKAAENDLRKAQSNLQGLRDFYVPSVMLTGGAGYAYGITLTVPTIFTVNAQSMVFSLQQRSYIHAARTDLEAAKFQLQEVRQQVEEDAAITYLSLETAQQTAAALKEQYELAEKLAAIIQDRLNAGLDNELEVKKYRRGAIQIKLAMMQAADSVEDLSGHLGQLTGIPADQLKIVPETIPAFSSAREAASDQHLPDTPGIAAAALTDRAKQVRAHGDAEYTWRPIIGFGASYGRISPINDVQSFYNLHGNYNAASAGISIQFPVFDKVRKQTAAQSGLDAARSAMDLESLRSDETSSRHKLERSLPELQAKAELADIDLEIAQDSLTTVDSQSQHDITAAPITPKEVENARIEERQKYVEMLDAHLQARKAQITLLRLTGNLDKWLVSIGNNAIVSP
jgi:outer membrane protein TolC